MCDYDGRRVSTLSKNFEKNAILIIPQRDIYNRRQESQKLSKKYQAILERIFIGDEDPKIVGKEYNKTLTEHNFPNGKLRHHFQLSEYRLSPDYKFLVSISPELSKILFF